MSFLLWSVRKTILLRSLIIKISSRKLSQAHYETSLVIMKKIISLGVVLGFPMLAFAQTQTLFGIIAIINQILAFLIPVLITAAVVYFIWGVVQYTIAASDEEAKKAGRSKIINGLIGLFVIIAFWGIIRIVTTTFGVKGGQLDPSEIPCIPNSQMGITCP